MYKSKIKKISYFYIVGILCVMVTTKAHAYCWYENDGKRQCASTGGFAVNPSVNSSNFEVRLEDEPSVSQLKENFAIRCDIRKSNDPSFPSISTGIVAFRWNDLAPIHNSQKTITLTYLTKVMVIVFGEDENGENSTVINIEDKDTHLIKVYKSNIIPSLNLEHGLSLICVGDA